MSWRLFELFDFEVKIMKRWAKKNRYIYTPTPDEIRVNHITTTMSSSVVVYRRYFSSFRFVVAWNTLVVKMSSGLMKACCTKPRVHYLYITWMCCVIGGYWITETYNTHCSDQANFMCTRFIELIIAAI